MVAKCHLVETVGQFGGCPRLRPDRQVLPTTLGGLWVAVAEDQQRGHRFRFAHSSLLYHMSAHYQDSFLYRNQVGLARVQQLSPECAGEVLLRGIL